MAALAWKRLAPAALVAAAACALVAVYAARSHSGHEAHASLEALDRTLLRIEPPQPIAVPQLVAADGTPLAPEWLRGRWSVLFFGFTSCPDVCPTTLRTLSDVARDPASGVASGATRIVFVSVDPRTDTPERMRGYLANFDARIVGLSGGEQAVERFATAAGASFAAKGGGFDHSTSLFVVDPSGRLAAVMLRPAEARRIVADLASLRGPDG